VNTARRGSLSQQIGVPPGVGAYSYYTVARGSEVIPTQIYHDISLTYASAALRQVVRAATASKSWLNSEFITE